MRCKHVVFLSISGAEPSTNVLLDIPLRFLRLTIITVGQFAIGIFLKVPMKTAIAFAPKKTEHVSVIIAA